MKRMKKKTDKKKNNMILCQACHIAIKRKIGGTKKYIYSVNGLIRE